MLTKKLRTTPLMSFLSLICLSSCSIYQHDFDCPPPNGIPCTSVTEIEAMIVETSKGPDLLPGPATDEKGCCFFCGQKKLKGCTSYSQKNNTTKIWICSQIQDGVSVKGYYVKEKQKGNTTTDQEFEPEDFFINSNCYSLSQD